MRNRMLKLIPHIADGSWVIKSSVGTTPVILGKVSAGIIMPSQGCGALHAILSLGR